METRHILIVDDEEDHRLILADLLESKGYSISTAKNAKLALAEISTRTVDLVITDFMMPGMNGLELIRALGRKEWLKGIPVILLTADKNENLKGLARCAGAYSTIFKPFNFNSLLTLIHSAIEQTEPVPSECS
ncbi:MAG: response regulator [Nitrospirales bacterium]|nr:response regulator [Nitrospirales bacterium]